MGIYINFRGLLSGHTEKVFLFFLSFVIFSGVATTNSWGQCEKEPGEIRGNVHDDINFNGIVDAPDSGVEGVKVLAYDSHQKLVSHSVTDQNGHYSLVGLDDALNYRIEFEYSDMYYPVPGSKYVLFVKPNTCGNDLVLQNPFLYESDDVFVGMSVLYREPLDHASSDKDVLFYYDYDYTGSKPDFKQIVKKSEVGAIWGTVFSRTTQRLFSSAFVKQHAYLGPHGHGAIYSIERDGDDWSPELYVDLVDKGIDIGELSVTDPKDCAYGVQVSRVGLGALALSQDEKYLYVTNLHKNELVKIPTDKNKLDQIEEIPIPDPQCTGGDRHAFALESYKGKLYVGVSCGAEYIKDEKYNTFHIYEFDPVTNNFDLIFETDYPKGYIQDMVLPKNIETQHWLTDIEFTDEGNMVILLNDRISHTYCDDTDYPVLHVNDGDILLVGNNNGTWELESNGSVVGLTGTGVDNGEGPGGGEFFGYDYWPKESVRHPETATGSALVIKGRSEVVVPVYDPEETAYSGGVKFFGTSDGELNKVFTVYKRALGNEPEFGKASGFGDLDVIYDPLPLEIGDYVWFDEDKDGVQDPDEHGLSDVELSLYDSKCNLVGSTKTNSEGYYTFNNTNVDLDGDGNFDNLNLLDKYYVVFSDSRFQSDKFTVSNSEVYFLTVSDQGSGNNKDKNDSDAKIASDVCTEFDGKPFVEVETKGSGHNDYDADFGFADVKIFDLALRKLLVDKSTVKLGDEIVFDIIVYNQGTLDAKDIEITDYINKGYEFNKADNPLWTTNADLSQAYYVHKSILKPGDSINVKIKMKLTDNTNVNNFINYAEISGGTDGKGNEVKDIDSTPDKDVANDIGGVPDFGENTGVVITDNVIDNDGSYDEDDHDVASPYLLDLALRKRIKETSAIYKEGDTVTFAIEVFNQGNIIATNYELVDYIGEDLIFDPSLNSSWKQASDGTATLVVNQELLPQESRKFEINLIIKPGVKLEEILNYAEISKEQAKGEPAPRDFDSKYNNISTDDTGAQVGKATDDLISSHSKSPLPDEDDHDVAAVTVTDFDLALVKRAQSNVIENGDNVKFTIKVFNQGKITADNITVVDYLPEGFDLVDNSWSYITGSSDKVEKTLSRDNGLLPSVGLLPGDSIAVEIELKLDTAGLGAIDILRNYAEIKSAYDIAGSNLGIYDVDSYPDADNTNDEKGDDNQLNGDGADDEDDHDWADVFIRYSVVVDPCVCLGNATNSKNGQYRQKISLVSPSGQNWVIDSVSHFYNDLLTPDPPAATVPYTVGDALTEVPNTPPNGISTYEITGKYVENTHYYIRFKNDLGDTKIVDSHTGTICVYGDPEIVGNKGTCLNSREVYSISNYDPAATYTWSLPGGGGSFVGGSTGRTVSIDWGGGFGEYELKVVPSGTPTDPICIAPAVLEVKVGVASGALAVEDLVIASVGKYCKYVVTPEAVITTPVNSETPFNIVLIAPNGETLPDSTIGAEYIGQDIMVIIEDECGGNQAMTTVRIIDKLSPVITCVNDTIDCDSMVTYSGPKIEDNCSEDVDLIIIGEKVEKQDCSNKDFIKIVTREYQAIDQSGNISESCQQKIWVNRIKLDKVEYPKDFLVSDTTALTCGADYELDDNGNPDPSVTGAPLYNGKNLYTVCSNNFCETSVGYSDFVDENSCCIKTIKRTWYVFDNCDEIDVSKLHVQTIQINDVIPPIPSVPLNMEVTTNGYNCEADVNLPALEITDNCSKEFVVDITSPAGVVKNSNGARVALPVGEHIINYKVYDKCGNHSEVNMKVKVEDHTPPIAICQKNTTVSLSTDGKADVPASSFDAGSYDGCGVADISVRRMNGGVFNSTVPFDCKDLDSQKIVVVLRVTDINGNINECMVDVEVQHKYAPDISCPDDMTVECDFVYDIDSLSLAFGQAEGFDVCGVKVTEEEPKVDISQCQVGTITREFVAEGKKGLKKKCTQTITFINSKPFVRSDVTWPQDTTFFGCDVFGLTPDSLGVPILKEDKCDIVGISFEDQKFTGLHDQACYTIIRTWKVYNECADTSWYNDQLISIVNNDDPFIEPFAEDTVVVCTYDENCELGDIELNASGSDPCTITLGDDLKWTYHIDLFDDGVVDETGEKRGANVSLSGSYPIGTHSILWQLRDGCGNSTGRSQYFTIKNCKLPSVKCIDSLIVELGPDIVNGDTFATAEVLAALFDKGSSHSCGYDLTFSYSEDVNDTLLVVDCEWLTYETHTIKVYATDENGNSDYCVTHLEVQDNGNICDPTYRCVIFPEDTVIINECNPDLEPGNGLLYNVVVGDDCDCDQYDISYEDTYSNDPTNTCQHFERKWTVILHCQVLDTTIYYTQDITLINAEAPDLVCPSSIVVDLDDTNNCKKYINIPEPTYDVDACNEDVVVRHDSPYAINLDGANASGTYPVGTTTVTFTLTDKCSNTSTCSLDITIRDNIAPLCVPNDTTVALDQNGNIVIDESFVASGSSDNCSNATITVEPNSFDCGDLGVKTVNITVSDGVNESLCTAQVTVIDTITKLCNAVDTTLILDENSSGTITVDYVYAGSGGCGGTTDVSVEVTPVDFDCEDLGDNTVQLIVTDNSTGEKDTCEAVVTVVDTVRHLCNTVDTVLVMNTSGTLTIEPEFVFAGYLGCWDASDVDLTVEPNTFNCTNLGENTVDLIVKYNALGESDTCQANVTIIDTLSALCNAHDTTIYLDASGNYTLDPYDVYEGAGVCKIIDGVTVVVEPDTFDCDDLGVNEVAIIVTDVITGNIDTCYAEVTVLDTITQLCNAQDITLILDENGDVTLNPEDLYSGSGGCGGTPDLDLSVDQEAFDCEDLGENIVQLIVTDNSTGEKDTCEAVVTVVDTVRHLCNTVDTVLVINTSGTLTIEPEFVFAGYLGCWDASDVDLTVEPNTFNCTNLGENTVDLIVKYNALGESDTCQANVTIIDTLSALCNAHDTTIYLDASGNYTLDPYDVYSGSGVCQEVGGVTLVVEPDTFDCDDLGVNEVAIVVTDVITGNIDTCYAEVTVLDTITQLCNAQDITLILDENGDITLNPEDLYSGSGGCGGTPNLDLSVDQEAFDCEDLGENVVQLIVTDNSTGEKDTCEAIVTIKDTIAPQCLVIQNDTVYLDSLGATSLGFEDINDGSFDPCGVIVDTILSGNEFECSDIVEVQTVSVTLTDNSGNQSICQTSVVVLDTIAPACKAVDTLYYSLDDTGIAVITDSLVDDGSYDECGIIIGGSSVIYSCNDSGIEQRYVLRVTDPSGNESECMAYVVIQDITPPIIKCPKDTTVSCLGVPDGDLSLVFGLPIITDNCIQSTSYKETDVSDIDNCGSGYIARNFEVYDDSGNTDLCTQLITVEAELDNFDGEDDITWPQDTVIVDNCVSLDPDSIGSVPQLDLSGAGCAEILAINEDIDDTPGMSCNDTIQRHWIVVDSCQYQNDPNTGVYEFTQVIIIHDTQAPVIIAPGDTSVSKQVLTCELNEYIDLYGSVIDCNPNVVVTNDSPYSDDPNSADASGSYPNGIYEITITATDECGGVSTYTYTLSVYVYSPNYCVKVSKEIDEEKRAVVHLEEVINSSLENVCSQFSFSNTNPNLDSVEYNCDNVGENIQFVYYFNPSGVVFDSCKMLIRVTDEGGVCTGGTGGIIGSINTVSGDAVQNANVYLSGFETNKVRTNTDGKFEFSPLEANHKYTVSVSKNNDILNGVNTLDIIAIQKHILAIGKITSPYTKIAADVNNDKRITAADVLYLRKLILGDIDGFANNESWRFISAEYEFENPRHPLNEEFSEEYEFVNINSLLNADFVGVKVGDVNNTVVANSLMGIMERESRVIKLYSDNISLNSGDFVDIPIKVVSKEKFAGIQFTMNFDTRYLEFVDIESGELNVSNQNIGVRRIERGIVTFLWHSTEDGEFDGENELFSLKFKVKESADLEDVIRLTDDVTPRGVYNSDGKQGSVQLLFFDSDNSFVLNQNEPNPWNNSTTFTYVLPSDGKVRVTINNGFGITLYKEQLDGYRGVNAFTISKEFADYTGVLFVDFEYEGRHIVKRMIKLK